MTPKKLVLIETSLKVLLYSFVIGYLSYDHATGTTFYISFGAIALFLLYSIASLISQGAKAPLTSQFRSSVYLLVISTCALFYLNSLKLSEKAEDYLWKTAKLMQIECVKEGKCPKAPKGWIKSFSRYSYDFMNGNTKFYMYYQSTEQNFNIYLSYGPDADYPLNGGVNKPVSYGWAL
ncbi:MAG: hypothetical protein GY787_23015 [Alteromonadales bacterium]|nr:hypothetical protein [Alteromonadales bacterium]